LSTASLLFMPSNKQPTSYRLSEECRSLLEQLSAALGISQTGVIEQAIRKFARDELPQAEEKPAPKRRRGKGD
jgi:hypothetical protein